MWLETIMEPVHSRINPNVKKLKVWWLRSERQAM